MTREDLWQLATRLTQGPVPTLQKKVYGYQGRINILLEALPPMITLPTRITDACRKDALPAQSESFPVYLRECLASHIRDLQTSHRTSIIVLQEAIVLARYRVPLSLFYDLTGDAHALILHLQRSVLPKACTFPPYVRYDPEAPAAYFVQALGDQFICDDRSEDGLP
jgi:hypothetical protein